MVSCRRFGNSHWCLTMIQITKKAKQMPAAQRTTTQEKKYKNVPEMVRDLTEDKELAENIARDIEQRNIIDFLMALRTANDLSQSDIAKKMGCSQSRVSKLENGKDNDLRIGDFDAYVSALGLEMSIGLVKKNRTIVDDMKYHAR